MNSRIFVCFILLVALTACGGGGGGGGVGGGNTSITILLLDANPFQASVGAGGSRYYQVDVPTNATLTFSLMTQRGDADLAVFSGQPLDQGTLIGFSVNTGTSTDAVQYTSTQAGTLYIEVGGFLSSQFTIQVTSAGSLGSVPIISAMPPTSVNEGGDFSFQIFAQVLNNPTPTFTYDLIYGPSGMQVDPLGNVSWVAHGAIFDTSADTRYEVRVNNGQYSNAYQGTVTVLDSSQAEPLMRAHLHLPGTVDAVFPADLDLDGKDELLISDYGKHIYILEEVLGSYEQTWMLPVNHAGEGFYRSVNAADLNGDGYPEIIIGINDYNPAGTQDSIRILILDGQTRKAINEVTITGPQLLYGLSTADVDNDGETEILFVAKHDRFTPITLPVRLYVLDGNTLNIEWESGDLPSNTQSPLPQNKRIAIGQLDSDAYLEIALNGGQVFAFNGFAYINKWTHTTVFGEYVSIADIEGDQIGEIVTEQGIYSLQTGTLILDLPPLASGSYSTLATADYDADSNMEILVSGSPGYIYVYDYSSTTGLLYEVTRSAITPPDDVIVMGQVDGDNGIEMIHVGWGYINVSSLSTGLPTEWTSASMPVLDGPYVGGMWTSLNTTDKRAVFATETSGPGPSGTHIVTLDQTGNVTPSSTQMDRNWNNEIALAASDYDGDSETEIFYGSSNFYDGYLSAYNFLGNTKEWTSANDIGVTHAIAASDINNDGADDLVTIIRQNLITELRVYDVLNQMQLQAIPVTDPVPRDFSVSNIDNDVQKEILVIGGQVLNVYGPNGNGGLSLENNAPLSISPDLIEVGDIDGDGVPEIILIDTAIPGSSSNSVITILDNNLNQISSQMVDVGSLITEFIIEPGANSRKNIIAAYTNNGNAYLAWLDPGAGVLISRSPDLAGAIQPRSLHVSDINSDSQLDLIFGTTEGMYMTQ